MKPLTILTVLKSGPNWLPDYVYKFKSNLDKNLTIPYNFYCLSDITLDVPTIPLIDSGEGFWNKIQLFRPELNFQKKCLYFDLDTIFASNIDEIIKSFYDYKFLMLQDPYKPWQSGSGMMWWDGDYSHLWKEYVSKNPSYWASIYKEHPRYGDQGFIIDRVEHNQIQEIISNKKDFCKFTKKESPKDAKIIIFAGKNRKPWLNLHHPDVIKHWI